MIDGADTFPAATDRAVFTRLLLAVWLAACAILLVVHWQSITSFDMANPDDHMRLVQVRDWLAGQAWTDVSQHRMNPPMGGDMHWSRIVDLPLAGGILLLTPLLGTHLAETLTFALVPLLLLGATMAALALAVRPLLGPFGAALTALLVILMPSLPNQLAPMRIDHHGWQIALAAICMALLFLRNGRRSGAAAGFAAALWVHVSVEALPYVAVIGTLLGVRYLLSEEERPRFLGYIFSLAASSLILFLISRPPGEWLVPKCDALSTPFILPFLAVAGIAGAGARLSLACSLAGRAATLIVAGMVATALLAATGSACAGGPFGMLNPVVRSFWYLTVEEGLPIWMQPLDVALGTLWTPLIGGIGTLLAWRTSNGDKAQHWAVIGVLFAAATGVALLVQRADAVAHLYALPGCGYLLLALFRRVSALSFAAVRVPLTALVFVVPSPAAVIIAADHLRGDGTEGPQQAVVEGRTCTRASDFAALGQLPPARLLAPIDIGPALLASTPHSVLAAGYHRNHLPMRDVILAFLGTPEQARDLIEDRGVSMVVLCSMLAEADRYREAAPDGFMAQLVRGDVPAWLEPVPAARSLTVRAWRVKPSA